MNAKQSTCQVNRSVLIITVIDIKVGENEEGLGLMSYTVLLYGDWVGGVRPRHRGQGSRPVLPTPLSSGHLP